MPSELVASTARGPVDAVRRSAPFLRGIAPAILAVLCAWPLAVTGQSYPNHAIRMIVPYPAGGSVDVLGRAVTDKLTVALGQPVIADNRVGANGTIAHQLVAASNRRPDPGAVRSGADLAAADSRWQRLPDVPTVAESGYPSYEFVVWYAFIAPAATPAPIVARVNAEINKVLRDPEMKARFAALGANLTESTPDECAAFVKSELALWGKMMADVGIKPE